jgi:hypothetical protein
MSKKNFACIKIMKMGSKESVKDFELSVNLISEIHGGDMIEVFPSTVIHRPIAIIHYMKGSDEE